MTIIERVLLLQNVDLFADVTTEQLSYIAAIGREIEVDSGKVLYRESDLADGMYLVISGAVAACTAPAPRTRAEGTQSPAALRRLATPALAGVFFVTVFLATVGRVRTLFICAKDQTRLRPLRLASYSA